MMGHFMLAKIRRVLAALVGMLITIGWGVSTETLVLILFCRQSFEVL